MRKIMRIVAYLAISVCALAADTGQPLDVKIGLWQIDMRLDYSGLPPQMQAMLDRMTPQQRATMGLGGTKTYKQCVTAKQLHTPWVEGDESCDWTVLKSTSSDLDVRGSSCRAGRNDGLSTNVEVKIHKLDSEHVQATIHGSGTGNGVNATLDGNYAGKWLAASCPAGTE